MNLGVWRMKDFMQSMCNVFVEVYAYIYIYIWARFMVLYLIHYFSGGPEKHARPYIYIYIYILYTPGPSNGCPMEIPDSSAGVVQLVGHPDGRLTGRFPERNEKRS